MIIKIIAIIAPELASGYYASFVEQLQKLIDFCNRNASLLSHRAPCLLAKCFCVKNHSIHIKNDCFCHAFSLPLLNSLFSSYIIT